MNNNINNNSNNLSYRRPHLKTIRIPIKVDGDFYCQNIHESFGMNISYSSSIQIQHIMNKTIGMLNNKYYPISYSILWIEEKSFTGFAHEDYGCEWNKIRPTSLTKYKREDIIKKGLEFGVKIRKTHNINDNQITCKYIKAYNEKCVYQQNPIGPLSCPIYKSMIMNYKFNEINLNHLYEFIHFENEYKDKEKCKFGQDCKSFVRLQEGGNRLDDRCHIKLFVHPPRSNRQINMSHNMNSFLFHSNKQQNHPMYTLSDDDIKKYEHGYEALIEEVCENGFGYDLCLECSKNDVCNHSSYSIMTVVREKLDHIRHRQIGCPLSYADMLSIVLYTSCDCNYDLCRSQRNGDYLKWKYFDYFLYNAIWTLSNREKGSYKLYSGLHQVKLDKTDVELGYFATYISASWNKKVALSFMKHEGMLVHIDANFREKNYCCDVSWISKFPHECEILIARSTGNYHTNFGMSILDEHNGIQSVSVHRSVKSDGFH